MKVTLETVHPNLNTVRLFHKGTDLRLHFSYETCVAMEENGTLCVRSPGPWSKTTSKHLSIVAPGSVESPTKEDFEATISESIAKMLTDES